jgi:hypothetical protein
MLQDVITPSWRFWVFWALAFLGFPIGGLLANVIVGPISSVVRAGIGGVIAGAALGLIQWLVLRGQIPLSFWWIVATSVGMGLGQIISVAFLGSETSGDVLLWRAVITGVFIGAAQWILLREVSPLMWTWMIVIPVAWVIGWFITRSAGIDLDQKWVVFGSSGAIIFQLLTGVALFFLLRTLARIE